MVQVENGIPGTGKEVAHITANTCMTTIMHLVSRRNRFSFQLNTERLVRWTVGRILHSCTVQINPIRRIDTACQAVCSDQFTRTESKLIVFERPVLDASQERGRIDP